MPEAATLAVFALAALVLVAVPGPNLVYITTRALADGRRAGLASALGVETGTLVHVAAAAAGLSAVLASSATAFEAVRWAGVAYLVYLGVKALRGGNGGHAGAPPPPVALRVAYRQALVVQLLNPKVALFFLAFLPQFVDPARGGAALQVLALGAVLAVLGLAVDCAYALAAGVVGGRLRGRGGGGGRGRLVAGTIYLALALWAALAGRSAASVAPPR